MPDEQHEPRRAIDRAMREAFLRELDTVKRDIASLTIAVFGHPAAGDADKGIAGDIKDIKTQMNRLYLAIVTGTISVLASGASIVLSHAI